VSETEIARTVRASGPLGRLGLGDRACTVSHTWAWSAFLDGGAAHALFLEDDVFLAGDIARCLADDIWIPKGTGAVKLEKYGCGASRILLADAIGATPSGRALRPMRSRHVGSGAYILSRAAAALAQAHRGRFRAPIDHFLFNDTVSPIRKALNPVLVVPPMATQRAYGWDSDIAPLGFKPSGWRKGLRTMRRGVTEANQFPRQLWQAMTGRARLVDVAYAETPLAPEA